MKNELNKIKELAKGKQGTLPHKPSDKPYPVYEGSIINPQSLHKSVSNNVF